MSQRYCKLHVYDHEGTCHMKPCAYYYYYYYYYCYYYYYYYHHQYYYYLQERPREKPVFVLQLFALCSRLELHAKDLQSHLTGFDGQATLMPVWRVEALQVLC